MSGDVRFQRVVSVDCGKASIIIDGLSRAFSESYRNVNLELTVIDRVRGRALSALLDSADIQELLKCLIEFAGEVRLGELAAKESC